MKLANSHPMASRSFFTGESIVLCAFNPFGCAMTRNSTDEVLVFCPPSFTLSFLKGCL
ncbi:hypothetical protein QZG57_06980 [Corynebacterium glucuronolyticum]|uniref:hypothetical protein n=1 Tax=Corynebacterium glucuronolyticum TaxID=39791 RepID=UPI00223BC7EA|nr:hypothetical protein [Corynebacterium glucuronolyticum]MCT1442058.1 hypothetical protein [Corynebacterium glucuronolyticum]